MPACGAVDYIVGMGKRKHSADELTVHRGSGNFLADQGIADPDEFRVKTHLCHEIAIIAERRGLTTADLAKLAVEPEPDIERIVQSRHNGYEVWRLMKILTAFGADVCIYVVPDSGHDRGVVLSETIDSVQID